MNTKKILIIFGAFLVVFWLLNDFIFEPRREFKAVHEFEFQNKSSRTISKSMQEESRKLVSSRSERDQIIGFVNIIECNHYLLYKKKITLESYYDFVENILHPEQKVHLKSKTDYAYQVNKYMRRMRKTEYDYLKYEISEPRFYYEEFSRNAKVTLIRHTVDRREFLTYYFRKYKGRYYFYLKMDPV